MTAQNKKCEMILETHSELSSGKSCLQLIQALEEPIGILWDAHHTWKLEGESPESTWDALSGHIRHIHYKDSFPDASAKGGFRYVPPGCGDFPSEDLFRLLKAKGYSGGVSLEWEKLWHQELCDLVEVLPPFAAMAKGRSLVSKT
jgi:sugar phosphate isomerase/epimerase